VKKLMNGGPFARAPAAERRELLLHRFRIDFDGQQQRLVSKLCLVFRARL